MVRIVLGSAVVGVVIALGMSAILRMIDFEVDNAVVGAMAGIGAGIYASKVRGRA